VAAVALITTAALAGVVDLGNSVSLNEIVQAAIPKLNTAVSQAYQEIEANLILTPIPRYDDTNHPQIFPNVSLDITKISLPASSVENPPIVVLSAPELDRAETATATAKKYSEAVLLNKSTDSVMAVLNGNFTSSQETELSAALVADDLVSRIAPTVNGASAATVIDKLSPVNPFVTGAVVRLASQGLQSSVLQQKIATDPTSKTAQFFQKNPRLLVHTITGLNKLEDTARFDLGKEISTHIAKKAAGEGTLPPTVRSPNPPGPLSGISRQFQSITNRVSGLLPGKAGQFFNAVAHPFQFVQGKIGNFIGNQVVGRFKNWLAEKVVSKIANETLKKAAGFVLKKGLQEGVKLLAKEGLKRGLQAVAQLANIAPGAGLLIAAAIEVGSWLLEKTFGLVKNTINGLSRALPGEDFDGKALIAAPLIALAGIGGVLGSLAAATAAAASSAAIVIMGSAAAGFFLYMTVITVAPIITTIAHLESGISDTSRVGVIGEGSPALLPPGPLPDSCPQGSPQSGYGVTQGPNIGSHTSGWGINIAGVAFISEGEAIDYGTPMNTPIYATHDGQAYYYQQYDNPPDGYGNYVAIIGNCPNPATGQTIQFLTTYAHLNAGNISRGGPTTVARGQMIGLSDNSGHSTGPHLHYEIFGLGDINRYVGP
jgi:murein DD-endopeptidase MepM/ murein hydrolase activator NlpD